MKLPVVGTLTVRSPAATPKSPSTATVTVTVRGDAGAGLAVTVKVASPPSVTGDAPAAIDTTGGGRSSSAMDTLPDAGAPTV